MKKLLLVLLALLLTLSIPVTSLAAVKNPLDVINEYLIAVEPQTNGHLRIRYSITWTVLDDKGGKEGVSWIKVGVPNDDYKITLNSSNLKSAEDYNRNGSYVRLNLDREYLKGESFTVGFEIIQGHMYVIDNEKHECKYSFTPGWFDEIEVQKYNIVWDARNVIECNSSIIKENFLDSGNDYYFWEGSLKQGERINASIKYNLDVFDTNESEQYIDNRENGGSSSAVIIFVIVLLVIFFILMIIAALSDYSSGGGFGGGGHTFISSCARSSCACASRCACACACAGGGRAGCNKKDFYKSIDIERLKNV